MFGAVTVAADPPDGPPGQDECSHGNSDKPCREDPQPDHGKDCEEHGNNGGINEDHCLATATTPPNSTNTPVPPTGTATATPVASSTATNTPVPPTGTPTATVGTTSQLGPAPTVVITQTTPVVVTPVVPAPRTFTAPAAGDGGLLP